MQFAFVYPGQGSQSVGMLSELAASYPQVQQAFEEVSDVIKVNLWKMVVSGPAEELNQTKNTQPALLAASYALTQVWQSNTSTQPLISAGHSFGEISAMCCGSALSFADAASVARQRGQLMQSAVAVGEGAMAAILGMADDPLEQLCRTISKEGAIVEAVNYNAPGQVVVAGHTTAVDALIESAKEQGAKRALKLPVSVPAHSSLMRPAAEAFVTVLDEVEWSLPTVPVIQNASLKAAADVDALKAALIAQLCSPVPWVKTISTIKESGVELVIELGPGKVLTGLAKRIDKTLKSVCVFDNASLEQAMTLSGE
ncbi:MAG: ACP S-malonyltransferase [Gammaproteobacteria bacterium]|nr:ACP S-malonyltransferase [Gammaproteobacteria bacterium]